MAEYSGKDNLTVMEGATNYNEFLLRLVKEDAQPGRRIVDFGAGAGTFAAPLSSMGFDVTCVETDPTLGEMLRGKGLQVLPGLDEVGEESVDYLYSLNVLEHIEDDEAILRLWHRKLRKGGKLLVYVPAFQSLFTSMDRKVGHFRRYTKGELCSRLRSTGFQIRDAGYADSVGYAASLVYKLTDRGEGDINPTMLRTYDRLVFPVSRLLDKVAHPLFGKNVFVRALRA
ncbi:SAM-dependent methyltransferase [Ramlibacter henchirensis]|uniref:SAM-dependent methyltransferase n=1 Tax=Ramlibacter henchirensis TaxID=204072 RepID=A0A4Z0C1Q7_9BURK|nr:class I SAM-dependent methyltransferase [Ramlibacter henchirensis]TFZ05171.1 SAM-dependent methyltransferase [Ramlibacter henchirensis]